jgi:hypothetical protein
VRKLINISVIITAFVLTLYYHSKADSETTDRRIQVG